MLKITPATPITVTFFGQSFRYSKCALRLSETRPEFYLAVGHAFRSYVIRVYREPVVAELPKLEHRARHFEFNATLIGFLFDVFGDEK